MKNNVDLVIEVWILEERGYHLAPDQRRLTTIQKLFLALGYPVYELFKKRKQEEFEKDNSTGSDTNSADKEVWRRQYLERRRNNAKKQGL